MASHCFMQRTMRICFSLSEVWFSNPHSNIPAVLICMIISACIFSHGRYMAFLSSYSLKFAQETAEIVFMVTTRMKYAPFSMVLRGAGSGSLIL